MTILIQLNDHDVTAGRPLHRERHAGSRARRPPWRPSAATAALEGTSFRSIAAALARGSAAFGTGSLYAFPDFRVTLLTSRR